MDYLKILTCISLGLLSMPMAAQTGSIIFTEFMANPNQVSDANGEWVELYNTTDSLINLQDWVLKDSGTNWHQILDSLSISPHSYLVLARNRDSATNGGILVDYEYSSFTLDNQEDELILLSDNLIIDEFAYPNGFTIAPGKSNALSGRKLNAQSNDSLVYWCNEAFNYGNGDLGSPGKKNIACNLNSGDIIISEIMIDPVKVNDVDGEWFELYNTSDYPLNLQGITFSDRDGDLHTIETELGIMDSQYVVLTRNPNVLENGGVLPHYSYEGFLLSNEEDEIILYKGETFIDSVAYKRPEFPISQSKSINLDPEKFSYVLNNSGQNWCRATMVYGQGDKGTPGLPNEDCGALPVDLLYFVGKQTNHGILLEWETVYEEGHESFKIVHSSDAVSYRTLIEIANMQQNPTGENYSYYDVGRNNPTNYYRLIQTDIDGTSTLLSHIQVIHGVALVHVHPNPFSTMLTIRSTETPGKVELVNMFGTVLLTKFEKRAINTTALPSGFYLARIYVAGAVFLFKLMKY